MALSEADVPADGGARRELQEPRLTSSHFSTRHRASRCQADKVKHSGDPSWMARPFRQFNDFINLMSQMLVSWVPVICYLSEVVVFINLFCPCLGLCRYSKLWPNWKIIKVASNLVQKITRSCVTKKTQHWNDNTFAKKRTGVIQ